VIRRELIDAIGELDERFGIGCFEDDDYCRRAIAAGYLNVIARDVFVHHVGGATFRDSDVDYQALLNSNRIEFADKWNLASSGLSVGLTSQRELRLVAPGDGSLLLQPGSRSDSLAIRRGKETLLVPGTERGSSCLCMIVRDNENTIIPCLNSIRPWVDRMVVVDTGSRDRTPHLCRELGAEVYYFPWCDDFSAARNESLRHALGDWVFWMDSDDVIDSANGRSLQRLVRGCHNPNVLGYIWQVHCPGSNSHDLTVVDHVKLFRNRPDIRFEGRIHEQILLSIRRIGGEVAWTDLFVVHSGYDRTKVGQERKRQRDFRLLELELRDRPNHPFTLFNLGMTHADVGDSVEAVNYLNRCLAVSKPEESHVRKAHSILAHVLARIGKWNEAITRCEDGLRLYPLDEELRFRKGVLLCDAQRYSEAVVVFQDLIQRPDERHFTSAPAGLRGFMTSQNLAVAFEGLGRLADAEGQWRRVVAEMPTYRDGWRGLGETMLKIGKLDSVKGIASKLIEEHPEAGDGAVLLAKVALANGDKYRSREIMEDWTNRLPNNCQLKREWAGMLLEYFDAIDAEKQIASILNLDSHDAAAWHNLGMVRFLLGRPLEAVECFRQSLQYRPRYSMTLDALGRARAACGNAEDMQQSNRETRKTALEATDGVATEDAH